MTAVLHTLWVVLTFQHGEHDGGEEPATFDSEEGAIEYARSWAADVPYTKDTQHEVVVFKAITAFRGRRIVPVQHKVSLAKAPAP